MDVALKIKRKAIWVLYRSTYTCTYPKYNQHLCDVLVLRNFRKLLKFSGANDESDEKLSYCCELCVLRHSTEMTSPENSNAQSNVVGER